MTEADKPFGAYALPAIKARLTATAQALPANWFGRRAALILRRLALSGGAAVVDAKVEGLNLRLYMRDNVSERKFLFMPQFFDRFERGLLRARLKNGDIFIDIGANAGIYTLLAASLVGASGRVLAVEPNPAVLSRLSFNARLNDFENITTEQAGVSDAEGRFDLALDDTNLGGSSLVAARGRKTISIACRPLLAILEKHGIKKIDALKIDIEGAEDRALVPFLENAPRALLPRLMIIEDSATQWTRDLKGALSRAGYRLLRKTRMNLVWELA